MTNYYKMAIKWQSHFLNLRLDEHRVGFFDITAIVRNVSSLANTFV